jgi:hypothetical protein
MRRETNPHLPRDTGLDHEYINTGTRTQIAVKRLKAECTSYLQYQVIALRQSDPDTLSNMGPHRRAGENIAFGKASMTLRSTSQLTRCAP